jgi:hypothetical protein
MYLLKHAALRYAAMTILLMTVVQARPASAQTNPFQDIPISSALPGGGTFTGTLDIDRFVARGGVLYAVGAVTGTVTDAAGTLVGTVTDFAVNLPITSTQGSTCEILHLELGPLDLDLLGLQIRLNRVVLDITAEQGPGNLLGNLLCAIASLLDSNGSLRAITQHLNRLIGIFG